MKKVYIIIVNPVDKSMIQSSEVYEDDSLYLDKALGRYGLVQSDIIGSTQSNNGSESPISGEYNIISGVIIGTSKLISVIICTWK